MNATSSWRATMEREEPARIVRCPSCRKTVHWTTDNPHRPFCSERCKLIDFGGWADETHRISGEQAFDEKGSEDEG